MAKLTVITGPQASGKTTKARAIAEGKSLLEIQSYRLESPFVFSPLYDQEAEVVIIDTLMIQKLDTVIALSQSEKMTVEKRGFPAKEINTPSFIVVLDNERSYAEYLKAKGPNQFELIETRKEAHHA